MMKRGLIFILFVLLILVDKPLYGDTFKGRVIDADTKEPIEGAVVVATWHKARATPHGETSRLKDVKEALTDKNGEWVIEGPKGRWSGNITAIFTFLTGTYYTRPPEFIIFKPGYCPYGSLVDVCMRKEIKPMGHDKIAEGVTVELPRLTSGEDRVRVIPHPIDFNGNPRELYKKQREFIRLINEERRNLGLREFPIPKELER
jgi:hypothetical protein